MRKMTISERNSRVFIWAEAGRSLVFMIPVWIAFLQDRLSVSQISIYVAAIFATQLVLELPTGALADLIGRKRTIVLAYLVDAIQYILFVFAVSFPQFLILAGVSGLAEALRSGSLEAIVYDSLKQDKKEDSFSKIMAKQGLRFQIGLMISTFLGGFLYTQWQPLPFILTGTLLLGSSIASLYFVEPSIDSEKFGLVNYLRQIKWGAIEAFRTHKHRLISLYYIAVGSISWMCAIYFNDYILVDLKFDASTRGVIASILRLINISLLAKLLTNEKIFNFRRTIIFFPVLMMVGLLPGYWLSGYWGLPFVGLVMMSSTARWILLGKYTNAMFSSKYRATAISTLSMAIGGLVVLGIVISGPIMEAWGDTRLIYSLLGLLSMITIPPLAYRLIKNS